MNNTIIETAVIDGQNCLKFIFKGVFTHQDAVEASIEWQRYFKDHPQKMNVIFDASLMSNYEPMARATWQKTLSVLKNQIDSVWVITDSKIIAAGAKLMGIFTSFSIKAVGSQEKIVFQKEPQVA